MRTENAVILAAGLSSRFAPIAHETPKGLLRVRGEVLIERQITQLIDAGISEIVVVVGYQKEKFLYLQEKYGVHLVFNPLYRQQNNPSSLWAARDFLNNTYVCCSDNYFVENPYLDIPTESYYATVYAEGPTGEWCVAEDIDGRICGVTVGGHDAWIMLGHAFWDDLFSERFVQLLAENRENEQVFSRLWECLYLDHIRELPMKAKHYPAGQIYEFDCLEDLRKFDPAYLVKSGSPLMEALSQRLGCQESEIGSFQAIYRGGKAATGCTFLCRGRHFQYDYRSNELQTLD